MRFEHYRFGAIEIDGRTYEKDVVIDRGAVGKRKKKLSKRFRDQFGHTPLSAEERIPWNCKRLVVGTGATGALPIMADVRAEAIRRHVDLLEMPTRDAIELLRDNPKRTNAILHLTC